MTTGAREPTSSMLDVQDIKTEDLHFDRHNPRLFLDGDLTDQELITVLWRDFAVDEIAMSIAANGFFRHEPLFATVERGLKIVVEGNRRLAAVRLLLDSALRREVGATDLPTISAEAKQALQSLPVIDCQREAVWQFIGFKHVNGPQAWQAYAKAQYVAWVHNEIGVPLDEIARMIGDRHHTVRRLYRGLMVLHQAQNTGHFDLDDRWKRHFSFSHLYTGLDYQGMRAFLGIDNETSFRPDPVPVDHLKNLGDLCLWLYGQRSTNLRPKVKSQNPDLRNLISAIGDDKGLVALRRGLPLRVVLDITAGDEELFRGHLIDARYRLQQARGKQLTGDPGTADVLSTAREILDLAERLEADMRQQRLSRRDRDLRSTG